VSRPLGVGVIGSGPVTQAIHLPTLATLTDRLRVRHVMDVDAGVAEEVAARTGARASTTV
jgi:myo-inositol 2-dehydrogenase / D-chiro-inositol 1-dehydrogenase